MRWFYSILFYLILPFIFLRLWWRSRRLPSYRERIGERLGYYSFTLPKCIWVHAVSMGETLAAVPLIKALQAKYPQLPMVITTMTPTGAEQVKKSFGDSVKHVYVPYDFPGAVKRFLESMNPVIGIIMETELWPNLLFATRQKNIPICLLNARLSEKSARGYQRIANLTRAMLSSITVIAAHGYADAERFIALGASKDSVIVTGNLKFDLQLPDDLSAKTQALRTQFNNRFIWIAASTHEGEEEMVLAAHKKLLQQNKNALLILVPRHPDRFNSVAELIQQQNLTLARRSSQDICANATNVYLGDTMGELLLMYGASDAAFIGGSFIPRGGHNMLEPAALEKPLLTGPHLFNFAEISDMLSAANALIKVNHADELANQLQQFMQDEAARNAYGARALQVVAANRGALAKQLQLVNAILAK